LIYCVVAPLILVFNVITFGLFWFVYRYNTLYVTIPIEARVVYTGKNVPHCI
jgi:hypothetical protein